MSSATDELEPWVVLLGEGAGASLALWRMQDRQQDTLAMFSERQLAEAYADTHCPLPWQPQQLKKISLIQVLADCYEQGLRYATLNPTRDSARQIFVLREVLRAARESLK